MADYRSLQERSEGAGADAGDKKEAECSGLLGGYFAMALILFLMAIVILIIHSFTKRRKNLCLDCCSGRPGLITPVNLLHTGRYRLVYAVIFGAMSNLFLSFIIDGGAGALCASGTAPGLAFCRQVVSPVVLVILLCVVYAPVFAGVDAPVPLFGHTTGFLYTVVLMTTDFVFTSYFLRCSDSIDSVTVALSVLSNIPSYVFYVILLGWFFYQTVVDIAILCRGTSNTSDKSSGQYAFKYVRNLLKKKKVDASSGRRQQFISYIWAYKRGFRYPLKFLAPLMVIISVLFKLLFVIISYTYASSSLVDLWKSEGPPFLRKVSLNGTFVYGAVLDCLTGFVVMATLASVVTFLLCVALLVQMAAAVHKHLELAAQGKFNFYSGKPPSHTLILANSLKYCGYQIGYFIWAWIIYEIVTIAIGLVGLVFILGLKYLPDYFGSVILVIIISPVWLLIVALAQTLLCKFAFLNGDKGGKLLVLTNRNAFNWVSYFFFLYNAIVGFLGAILRAILAMLFGVLLLFRLDTNIMMRGLQFADLGNKTYQGFLYLEHTLNNPVGNAFITLLLSRARQPQQQEPNSYTHVEFGEMAKVEVQGFRAYKKRQIQNRWLVAYTLVHNPSLCQLRASNLGAEENMKGDNPELKF